MTRKIYRAFCKRYAVQVSINSISRLISFLPCNPVSGMNSMYITDDTDVQEALEKSSSFNVGFFLEKAMIHEGSKQIIPPTQTVVVPAEPEPTPEPDEAEPMNSPAETPEGTETERPNAGETHSVAGVTNMGVAKMQLLAMFPDDKSRLAELKKADEIRAFAKEKGVVFPDWL